MSSGNLGESQHKLCEPEPEPLANQYKASISSPRARKPLWLKLLIILPIVLILATVGSVAALFGIRNRVSYGSIRKPTVAIKKTCGRTFYPDICVESLVAFPGALSAEQDELVHISVNLTLQRFDKALSSVSEFVNVDMDSHARSAYADCLELLQDSVDHLFKSLSSIVVTPDDNDVDSEPSGSIDDVITWLSAVLTSQDTCNEGLGDVTGSLKDKMDEKLHNLWELASNSLAIYSSMKSDDFSTVPIQDKRRKLMSSKNHRHFPTWLSSRDRFLIDLPPEEIQADIVVAKDGSGDYKTIAEAIKKAPKKSKRRVIIFIKAGKYEEDNLKVERKKTNLMFIGDGVDKTMITGRKSVVADKITTFHTPCFVLDVVPWESIVNAGQKRYGGQIGFKWTLQAVDSSRSPNPFFRVFFRYYDNGHWQRFIARDITFENYAGSGNHQAVALRVGADHSVIYRCNIVGHQDTLYVHSQRQFYRECNIYGTVDFIFGNAAVVFQNCAMYARKPMEGQKNTITAQNRKDPNQNTGISIHDCKLLANPDLEASKGTYPTYLGRPWKMYSRTVYMLSYMGDHISPKGWLEWNETFALDTLFYGEYMNYGPGSATGGRESSGPGIR